jgi:Streptomyces sporulation and cell division protein, SsgA
VTSFSFDKPRQPDDSEYPTRDALDEIDEAVAQITDADIEERLHKTLRREGYDADQDITAMSTCPGNEERVLAVISACAQAQESMETAPRLGQDEACAAKQEAVVTEHPSTSTPGTMTAEICLQLAVPPGQAALLAASLLYSADDPYAVRFAFHVGLDEPVEWTFARDLLAGGTEGREGAGDVRVWPGDGADAHRVLNIELSSPYGQALLEASAADVAAFLARTYQLVPAGSEADHVDIDAELFSLRAGGGAW